MVEYTDDVEQLIKETDEAFQAVGFALGDAKAATQGFQAQPQPPQQQFDHTDTIINSHKFPRQNRLMTGTGNGIGIGNRSIARTNPMQNSNIIGKDPESSRSSGLAGKSPVPKSKKSNAPKAKKNIGPEKGSRKSLPHAHSGARWNLGDVTASVADVFKGRFARVEADEMLTPDRLQQLEEKAERAKLDNRRKASWENAQGEAARHAEAVKDVVDGINPMETSHKVDGDQKPDANIRSDDSNVIFPTEPIHLEHLLPRIKHDQTFNAPPHIASSAISTDPSESSERDQGLARKGLLEGPNPEYSEIDAIEQAFEDLNFPSPPRDSPPPRLPRSRSNTGITSLLPTIPEIPPLNISPLQTPPKRTFSPDSHCSRDSSASSSASADYIQLPSTPYTLTSPLFRHGPIRLENNPSHRHRHRHRRSRSHHDSIDLEEALDWTAFQMAISGTMDDGTLGVSEESIWEADEAEIDSILDWWAGFGYAGIGRLVREAPAVSRRRRGRSLAPEKVNAYPPGRGRDGDADVRAHRVTMSMGLGLGLGPVRFPGAFYGRPKTPEYQGGWWVDRIGNSNGAARPPQVVDSTRTQTQTQMQMRGARRDVVLKVNIPEEQPKINDDDDNDDDDDANDDDDDDSLPPSPINLVKIKDEYIPMGYNLGHDLGDFLNWETYHVCAESFWGA
ncbi:hypothetical protein DSL72_008545 [Monilinia vaccinii-corymbosi]|uniref:Uncharacterized protein n=1 Tax=Monilinia vaccinii-corymbosi TaxID=61207 RepID=A0A8A3PRE2_9HELO|nr:hypothetical protein DSL72_008545 [Monilinia vaccinii-corymbosi]